MNRTVLIAALALLGSGSGRALEPAVAAPAPARATKSLIYAGWFGNTIPTPKFIKDNLDFLESRPFDGLVVYLRNQNLTVDASHGVMTNTPMTYPDMAAMLDPIKNLPFSRLQNNFGYIVGHSPPDFFDDWSVPIQNFANIARALKEAGLKGFFFDNEDYFEPWGSWPDGVLDPTKTLLEYQAQAVLRGQQVMEAMIAEFPEIIVLSLHGAYISDPFCVDVLGFAGVPVENQLLGPFSVGFTQGAGASGQAVDGGELYRCRTPDDFLEMYDLRKTTIASATADCPYMSPALRANWPTLNSIAFGVHDGPFGGVDMNSSILTPTLVNALNQADRYVWFYTEDMTFLKPESQGGATQEWIDAIHLARGEDIGGRGGGGGSSCGMLGWEAVIIYGALLLIPRRRRNQK
jgi:hypothetical protein